MDGVWGKQPSNGQPGDGPGDDEQHDAVDEGGEDAGSLQAVGTTSGGRPHAEELSNEHEQDGRRISEVVAGIGHEPSRVGGSPGDDEASRQDHVEDERQAEASRPSHREP